jgi:hypothetical protein
MSDPVVVFETRYLDGAEVKCEYGSDGRLRLIIDHPSNDPEIEIRIGMKAVAMLRDAFVRAGETPPEMMHMIWRNDP